VKLLFSTNSVHPRDRLAFWREEATKALVAHEFSTPIGRNYRGEISAASLGNLDLAALQSDEARVVRSQRCIKFADDDDLLLCRQVSGSLRMHQDGREAASRPGDLCILDPRRRFALDATTNTHILIFKTPRSEMQARLGEIAKYTATPISLGQPVAALASDFLAMLPAHANAINISTGAMIAKQALDLAALAFQTVGNTIAQLSSPRATTLLRLKSIIETNLHNPAFKPTTAAQAAGISVRYANVLLANEGTSLERYIMLRRLERCRQVLLNPAHLSRTVSGIAYSYGFSDLSHFTRRFKKQFGCTPSEIRRKPESS
jgi:AraC family transcriptional regulator, positive regulator of tynA and feaB